MSSENKECENDLGTLACCAVLMLMIDFNTLASEVRRRKVRAASVVSSHP